MLTEEMEIFMEENQAEVKALLWKLCEIPSPSHHEERRAAFIKEWLEMQGAEGVFIDEAKNVIYPYHYEEGVPTALFMAHIDTVFPDMESMGVREEGGKMFSPGVGDDTANVAILMMMAKYVAKYHPKTNGNLIFAANACEEGLGNLKGSRALNSRYGKDLVQVVSFDGYMDSICTRAVGSVRYRVEVRTEGGHSYFNFGNRNALAELSALIQALYQYQVPQDGSKTTYNVGMVKGGTSINTIAQQAEMLYEFRSDNLESMEKVRDYFEETLEKFRKTGLGYPDRDHRRTSLRKKRKRGSAPERTCGTVPEDHYKTLWKRTGFSHLLPQTATFRCLLGFLLRPSAFAWATENTPEKSGSIQKA